MWWYTYVVVYVLTPNPSVKARLSVIAFISCFSKLRANPKQRSPPCLHTLI